MSNIKNRNQREEREVILRGVRVNNLKNIDLSFYTGKLIVVTGLSGSGKSSLVFDTLYAEGQRRYVESLSSYARQFLGRMEKPEVDFISGIAPAIAIEQKVLSKNPRSTVGTITEIYEYLKLLYARVGKIYSPISGKEVRRHTVTNVSDFICELEMGTRVYILAPIVSEKEHSLKERIESLKRMGFSRLYDNESSEVKYIEELEEDRLEEGKYSVLVDRFVVKSDDRSFYSSVFDSVQTAFSEGDGGCIVVCDNDKKERVLSFSNRLEADGMTFVKPSPNFFAFNNPYGACKKCGGTGLIVGESEDLVVPNQKLSVYEDAIACWRGSKMSEWKDIFIKGVSDSNFPIHRPYKDLTKEEKHLLWHGNKEIKGIYDWFKFVDVQAYKVQYRVLASRYRGKTRCMDCGGSRLREDAAFVKIGGRSIQELIELPIDKLYEFLEKLEFTAYEKQISRRMMTEIKQRLEYLLNVGVSYLSLNRAAGTLSGGEAQRIHLANAIGSSLVGSMYILDEPSIGLHPRDTENLIRVVKKLRDIGNTVVVVEHDEEMMRAADLIVDVGPLAGQNGGEIVYVGSPEEMLKHGQSLTAKYLRDELRVKLPTSRRAWTHYVEIKGARQHNLQSIDVKFPIGAMTVVTGVSGSGKTSLVKKTLCPALTRMLGEKCEEVGKFDTIAGSPGMIEAVELVDQEPIGRSSRSNPVTYVKAFEDIRSLFASQPLAKKRGLTMGSFSFNSEGGRCETCQGEGKVKIEMQFMADIYLQCEDCGGKRFKQEVLDVEYRGKNIADILEMTVDEFMDFMKEDSTSNNAAGAMGKVRALQEVGLGYLHLGQSSASLSGGEAQRIKLASFLRKGGSEKSTLFVFDEPTTGLHLHDIEKLRTSFDALIRVGHTVVVVEHHPDIIKLADWVIDIGPEGGEKGGRVVFEGTPEDLINCKESYTAAYLKDKLNLKNGSKK